MKVLLVVAVVIAYCQAASFFDLVQAQWGEFKETYNKTYDNETEERFRMKIFMENSRKVAKHNKMYARGLISYRLGINKFADMLPYEFSQMMNGSNKTQRSLNSDELDDAVTFIPPANIQLPPQIDWREKGAVTEVKDQYDCASCWSFSATGSLEGQHFRKTGKLVSLSEQQLIDCSHSFGNNGCEGGSMRYAFRYIQQNGGIDTEKSYPYEASDDFMCHYTPQNRGATDSGYVAIESGSEEDLQAAVATMGPVAVDIDASHESFQMYSDGVYYEPDCSSRRLDHGVLAVGYGTENGQDYWLIKNSWGPKWGDEGYIKMARNRNNNCGVASAASYPLV